MLVDRCVLNKNDPTSTILELQKLQIFEQCRHSRRIRTNKGDVEFFALVESSCLTPQPWLKNKACARCDHSKIVVWARKFWEADSEDELEVIVSATSRDQNLLQFSGAIDGVGEKRFLLHNSYPNAVHIDKGCEFDFTLLRRPTQELAHVKLSIAIFDSISGIEVDRGERCRLEITIPADESITDRQIATGREKGGVNVIEMAMAQVIAEAVGLVVGDGYRYLKGLRKDGLTDNPSVDLAGSTFSLTEPSVESFAVSLHEAWTGVVREAEIDAIRTKTKRYRRVSKEKNRLEENLDDAINKIERSEMETRVDARNDELRILAQEIDDLLRRIFGDDYELR